MATRPKTSSMWLTLVCIDSTVALMTRVICATSSLPAVFATSLKSSPVSPLTASMQARSGRRIARQINSANPKAMHNATPTAQITTQLTRHEAAV